MSSRFVYSRHVIFHARWVGRVQILQEIRMTTCSYCKVHIHIKNVKCSRVCSRWVHLCYVSCIFTEKHSSVFFISVLFHGQDTTLALNKIYSKCILYSFFFFLGNEKTQTSKRVQSQLEAGILESYNRTPRKSIYRFMEKVLIYLCGVYSLPFLIFIKDTTQGNLVL